MHDDVTALIASTLDVPVDRVTDDSDMSALPDWDSVAHINLMLAIEERYGITVDEDAMVELTSVRAIREYLERAPRA